MVEVLRLFQGVPHTETAITFNMPVRLTARKAATYLVRMGRSRRVEGTVWSVLVDQQ
jgi:hypothetical protein